MSDHWSQAPRAYLDEQPSGDWLGVDVYRRKTVKTNPLCRQSEADRARQAVSLCRPEDWEQGVGRRKKDGPEWLTVLMAEKKEKQEGNHHHA